MKPARIAVLAIALVAAAGSALLARGLVSDREPTEEVAAPVQIDTVDVLVTAVDIELGTVVKRADLSWQPWPTTAARSGFIRRDALPEAMEDFEGAIARMSLLSGEPVNDIKLVRSDTAGFMSAILPEGMRAISTKISPETGAGGFILPNDRVDVIMTRREQSGDGARREERHISTTVLTNVRVLAIDQAVAEKDEQRVVVGKTATLELNPEQAETLTLAQSMGEIALALRSLRDAGAGENVASTRNLRGSPSASVSIVRYGMRSHVAPGQ